MWYKANHVYTNSRTRENNSEAEAAELLGCSTRTLERRSDEWGLTRLQVDGKHGLETHYNTDELMKLKETLQTPIVVGRPRGTTQAATEQTALARITPQLAALVELIRGETATAAPAKPSVPITEKLIYTLAEAHAVSGISVETLRAAANAGELKTKQVRGIRGRCVTPDNLRAYVKRLMK